MQNRTISCQTTNIIEGAEIQVIHVYIVTPVRRLTPSDWKIVFQSETPYLYTDKSQFSGGTYFVLFLSHRYQKQYNKYDIVHRCDKNSCIWGTLVSIYLNSNLSARYKPGATKVLGFFVDNCDS